MAESKKKRVVYNYEDLYEITNLNVDINSLVDNRLYLNYIKYNTAGNPMPNNGIVSTTRIGTSIQQTIEDITGLKKCRYYLQGTWTEWKTVADPNDIYTDTTQSSTYIVPLSAFRKRRAFGMAIMGAWKDLFAVFFIGTDPLVTRLTNNNQMSCTVESVDGTENLKFTFGSTVWGGISILPL